MGEQTVGVHQGVRRGGAGDPYPGRQVAALEVQRHLLLGDGSPRGGARVSSAAWSRSDSQASAAGSAPAVTLASSSAGTSSRAVPRAGRSGSSHGAVAASPAGPTRPCRREHDPLARSHDRSRTSCRFTSTSARGEPAGRRPGAGAGRGECAVLVHRRLGRAVGEHHPSAMNSPSSASRRSRRRTPTGTPRGAGRRPAAPAPGRSCRREFPRRRPGEPLQDSVVPELPDEPALKAGGRLDRRPVVGQRPVAVAHRVGVLAQDHRLPLLPERACATIDSDRRVHRARDVGRDLRSRPAELGRALVLQRPGRIVRRTKPAAASWLRRSRSRCRATRRSRAGGSVPAHHP